jgi:hypothetical protein
MLGVALQIITCPAPFTQGSLGAYRVSTINYNLQTLSSMHYIGLLAEIQWTVLVFYGQNQHNPAP